MSIRMTSENPDTFHPVTDEEKELKILTVASIRTLKRGNKKYGNEEFEKDSIKDSIDSDITKEDFDKFLKIIVKNQSVERNKVGNQ